MVIHITGLAGCRDSAQGQLTPEGDVGNPRSMHSAQNAFLICSEGRTQIVMLHVHLKFLLWHHPAEQAK